MTINREANQRRAGAFSSCAVLPVVPTFGRTSYALSARSVALETNTWSRKANDLFKSHGIDARAEGNDYLGIIKIHGNAEAAEVVLAGAGFDTAVIGGQLVAQK
jgi:hypothetical protein